MKRVRTRGPRRRGDNHNLVRSVPSAPSIPPPIPLLGHIVRTVKLEAVADYEGLSSTSWTSGTTGIFSGVANTSWNAAYHHFLVPNRRDDTLTYIMDPVRWSCDAPAANGGTYDWWMSIGAGFRWDNQASFEIGRMAISEKLLAASSHGSPNEGFLLSSPFSTVLIGNSGEWIGWATLNALSSAGVLKCTHRFRAIRHRVNGSPVGPVHHWPGPVGSAGEEWRVAISAGDQYSIDVWYEIKYEANRFLTAGAGKCCLVFLQTRVLNGSRQPPVTAGGQQVTSGMPTTWRPSMRWSNVNWNVAFNRLLHTYNITIAGHAGWTLKGGSDGPHKMLSGDGWVGEVESGFIRWTAPASHEYVSYVVLRWDTEIATIEIKPKGLLDAALGWTAPHSLRLVYRPESSGDYRNTTFCTNIGGAVINSAPCGVFTQGGTTAWQLVPRSAEPVLAIDGYRGIVSTIIEVPLTITTSRTTQ